MSSASDLNRRIEACERCPRLRSYCATIAREKRRAYASWDYWGRPVPNFGSFPASLLIVGLAPAAHGANRTGRMFTGDRSGEWLYRALYKAGFASQPQASSHDDGMELLDCAITAVGHCAPPGNKPTRDEIEACRPWLLETIQLARPRAYVALGQIAWTALQGILRVAGAPRNTAPPRFAHGARWAAANGQVVLASYHPSQQNTFTGRLTEPMFDAIFAAAREIVGPSRPRSP